MIGSLIAAAVLLPLFVADREQGDRAPMLDLTLFKNRLFAAATAAAFINGLSRFALLFLFVFYFQGVQGRRPDHRRASSSSPMAIGMLISSPLAGIWADRRGSRMLAALGMLVSAVGLAGMTTLAGRPAPTGRPRCGCGLVGHRLGHVQLAEHRRDDGRRPANRRGIAAGARTMLQNTGAVLSIAFVLAIVTAAVPKDVLFKIFSGPGLGPAGRRARHLHPQHAHRALGPGRHLADRRGGLPSPAAARQASSGGCAAGRGSDRGMTEERRFRIGDLAKLTETTPRTIRYYEEIGLLASEKREPGEHRTYGEEDLERLQELLGLRELLGVSLEELRELAAAESARASLRREWQAGIEDPVRQRQVLEQSLGHIENQLSLLRHRRDEIDKLSGELETRRRRVRDRLRALERKGAGAKAG